LIIAWTWIRRGIGAAGGQGVRVSKSRKFKSVLGKCRCPQKVGGIFNQAVICAAKILDDTAVIVPDVGFFLSLATALAIKGIASAARLTGACSAIMPVGTAAAVPIEQYFVSGIGPCQQI